MLEHENLIYADVMQKVAFKKSEAFKSRPASVAAWLRQGELEAAKIECKLWNPRQFKASLFQIRALTQEKDPARFIPELQRICSECGIAVVIVRTPKGCPASGATRSFSR